MKSAMQMKLNPSPNPTKSDFITQVISSIEDGFIPSDWTDLVEKERQVFRLVFLFLNYNANFDAKVSWCIFAPLYCFGAFKS